MIFTPVLYDIYDKTKKNELLCFDCLHDEYPSLQHSFQTVSQREWLQNIATRTALNTNNVTAKNTNFDDRLPHHR